MNFFGFTFLPTVAVAATLCSCSGPAASTSAPASSYKAFDAWRTSSQIEPYAAKGSARALHDLFIADYTRASDPYLGGEDLQSMSMTLGAEARSVGDAKFAEALGRERPEVIHAVRVIAGGCLAGYPETLKLMSKNPRVKLPLEYSDEDIRTPLMKALIEEEG